MLLMRILILTTFLTGVVTTLQAATYYVAMNGKDSNSGASTQPFKTIQHAADITQPGDTVIVRDGNYVDADNDGMVLEIKNSGTAEAWVTYKSENKWGAVIDGQNNKTKNGVVFNGSYIHLENFEIKDTNETGLFSYFHHIDISGNNIHHIGKKCSNTVAGLVGMFLSANNLTIQKNVIHDIGRFAPGENGCKPTNVNYKNHDHAIYIEACKNVLIKNNTIYNIKRGWAIHSYNGNTSTVNDNIQVINNTFAFANPYQEAFIILASPGISNSTIKNNIFYQPKSAAIEYYELTASKVEVSNNIVYGGTISTGNAPLGISFSANQELNKKLYIQFLVRSVMPWIF